MKLTFNQLKPTTKVTPDHVLDHEMIETLASLNGMGDFSLLGFGPGFPQRMVAGLITVSLTIERSMWLLKEIRGHVDMLRIQD